MVFAILVVTALLAVPGEALAAETGSGESRSREYLVAFVGLVLIGMVALGVDFRDWL